MPSYAIDATTTQAAQMTYIYKNLRIKLPEVIRKMSRTDLFGSILHSNSLNRVTPKSRHRTLPKSQHVECPFLGQGPLVTSKMKHYGKNK